MLVTLINRTALEAMAGGAAFRRGEEYFSDGDLMKAHKKLSQYGDYLAELRLQFKPERNFIRLLDDVVRSMTFATLPL